jgi:hypothetical protein
MRERGTDFFTNGLSSRGLADAAGFFFNRLLTVIGTPSPGSAIEGRRSPLVRRDAGFFASRSGINEIVATRQVGCAVGISASPKTWEIVKLPGYRWDG